MVLHARVIANAGGGPDKTVLRSAAFAPQMRVRMTAAYLYPQGDPGIEVIRHHANRFGCSLCEIPESGPVDPWAIRSLLQLCRKLRVEVWHAHDYKSDALGLLLSRLHPMRLVTTVHGWTHETRRTRLYYRVDNWCIPRYRHVIAVSPKLRDHCLKLGVKPHRLSYIPNAIDPDEYLRQSTPQAIRYDLGVRADRLVIGVVGRLSKEKGVDRALKLVARLRDQHPLVELHLVGDGPERDRLEHLAAAMNIADRTCFWGWQESARRFYEMMDLVLLPSHTEGLPNTVLEAMAMGLPVAATDVGGVRDLLDDGACGVILPQLETIWPTLIEPLLSDAALRATLGQRSRWRIEEHFSFDTRMQRIAQVYDKVLEREATEETRRAA